MLCLILDWCSWILTLILHLVDPHLVDPMIMYTHMCVLQFESNLWQPGISETTCQCFFRICIMLLDLGV